MTESDVSTSRTPTPAGIRTVRSLVILGVSPSMLAFARRIAASGMKIHLVELVKGPRNFKRPMRAFQPEGITLDWSHVGTDAGVRILKEFADRVCADALLSSDDYTLWWLGKIRSHFEPVCTVLAPDHGVLERLWDKAHQVRHAAASGFEVLPGWDIAGADSIAAIPAACFPVVIRPSYPNSADPWFKARVIDSREELGRFHASTRWTHPPVVQQFCLGPNYVLHGMRSQDGAFQDFHFYKAYRKYHGFATSIEPATLPVRLESAARKLVEAEGLTGPFHFDLLGSDTEERCYFLEINCRLGGTTGKVVELGYDEPGALLAAFSVEPPAPLPTLRAYPRTCSFSLTLLQAWNELRNRRDPLAYPRTPRMTSFRDALKEALLVHHG